MEVIMFEYKIEKAKNMKIAEEIMNDYAKKGWRVVSVTYWTEWSVYLIITFERER